MHNPMVNIIQPNMGISMSGLGQDGVVWVVGPWPPHNDPKPWTDPMPDRQSPLQ
jgi:hypothetical protein